MIESDEVKKLKIAWQCGFQYHERGYKGEVYETWVYKRFKIEKTQAHNYKKCYPYIEEDGSTNLKDEKGNNFKLDQLIAMVSELKYENLIREACSLGLFISLDTRAKIREICKAWKQGERYFVHEPTSIFDSGEFPESRNEEKFLKKYGKLLKK